MQYIYFAIKVFKGINKKKLKPVQIAQTSNFVHFLRLYTRLVETFPIRTHELCHEMTRKMLNHKHKQRNKCPTKIFYVSTQN